MKRGLGAATLAFAIFCVVSGGPFGLEPLIGSVGPGLALVLILVTPFVWALPDALTTAELAAAIPEEGGYIVWVRRAMGPTIAFLNAWWSWLYTLVDAALYPVMFATYLNVLLKSAGYSFLDSGSADAQSLAQYGVSLIIIALFTWLNVRGTKIVGLASSVFSVAIILPFLALAIIAAWRVSHGEGRLPLIGIGSSGSKFADGLAIIMWNYLGWDALSTVASEVEKPERAYPRALAIGVPLVTAAYFLPTYFGLAFFPDAAKWQEGAWPAIASSVGGPNLRLAVNIAGIVSPLALFITSLLGSSRVPLVLAEEGYLPKALLNLHPKFGTPWKAILLCAAVYIVLAWQSFNKLVTLNVVLYGTALILEVVSLAVLRFKEPELPRPYRAPGGWLGLGLIVLLPALLVVLLVRQSVIEDGWKAQIPTAVALVSGPVVFLGVKLGSRRV